MPEENTEVEIYTTGNSKKPKIEPKDMKDQIKICLLGGSGTGKSCFFSGLYQSMVGDSVTIGHGKDSVDVFLNVIEMDKVESFFGDGGEIKNAIYHSAEMEKEYLIDENGFPPSTAESTVFIFELSVNSTVCCQVKIIDYAGELLDSPEEVSAQDLDKLCLLLADCDAIIVIADAIEIAKSINNKNQMQRVLHALRLNSLFTSILKTASKKNHRLSTLVALTKSDSALIPDNIKANNFSIVSDKIANEIFKKTLIQTQKAGGSTGVIPVTAVGDNNTDEDNLLKPEADITQKNIDVSILFCIYNAVERKISYQEQYLKELNDQLKRLGILGNRASKAALRKKISELTNRRDLLINIREILKSDSNYFEQNINELYMYGTSSVGETKRQMSEV